MEVNKVKVPAATKVAIGFVAFLTAPLLLLGLFDPLGLLVLVAYAVGGLFTALIVYLVVLRVAVTVTRRLAFRADLWFARKRAARGHLGKQFCLLLRSSQADVALSIDDGDGKEIRDAHALRLDVAPSFRSLLAHRMRPLYTLLVKNSEHVQDVVSVTYDDAAWRTHILGDMRSASLILVIPHWPSQAVAWELEQLGKEGHLEKTFIVMPPSYLFRPGASMQPALLARLVDRLRYMVRETLEAVAPDYFLGTRHTVSLEAERVLNAKAGWENARQVMANVGLQLPEYDPKGAFLLAVALQPPPQDASVLALDSHRIAVSAGTLDWRSNTTGPVMLSVARGR